ncbi:MAG: ankyrin repeat domain-containing protein [Marinilabiliales bacterium]|nr:MAG: ankyrin repeat domain-containing protein [Marinilabiliales bacterium]
MFRIIWLSIIIACATVFTATAYLADFNHLAGITGATLLLQEDNDTSLFLIMAADRGDADSVRLFIEKGYDVNQVTADGVTALMYAASAGHKEVAALLAESGADLDARPRNGLTALAGAVINNNYDIVLYLLQQGADTGLPDNGGVTPLMHAASLDLFDITELLLMFGAEPGTRDAEGATALHGAAIYAQTDIAWLLLDYGADVNSQDDFGFTPLMMAVQLGREDMANYLLENNADVNIRTRDGMTPLAIAIANNQANLAEILIDQGADPGVRLTETENLMNLARWQGNTELIELLREQGIRRNIIPDFATMQISAGMMFNTGDYFHGLQAGLEDSKYDLLLSAGWKTRPVRRAVLIEFSDNWYDQLWEQRHLFYGSLHKRIRILRPYAINTEGFYAGIRVMYSQGKYWGTYRYPEPRWHIVPSAGYYKEGSWWFYKVGYEYFDLNIIDKHGHRLSLKAGIRFRIRKDPLIYRTTYW